LGAARRVSGVDSFDCMVGWVSLWAGVTTHKALLDKKNLMMAPNDRNM